MLVSPIKINLTPITSLTLIPESLNGTLGITLPKLLMMVLKDLLLKILMEVLLMTNLLLSEKEL